MIDKYNSRARAADSLLCVGLDPDFPKIPEKFLASELPQFEFNKWIIDETHEYAAAFKLNATFYEGRGSKGVEELKKTFDYIRAEHPDMYMILDAKRSDIANSNSGYISYAFDWLGADAVTFYPYLGYEAVIPFLERKDKESIVLVRTSNPGAREFQDLPVSGGIPLWQHIAREVAGTWNKNKNCMMVIGATYPDDLKIARGIAPDMTFLIPGVGSQGGDAQSVIAQGLDSGGLGLIINASRSVIFAESPKEEARGLRDAMRAGKRGI